MTVQHKSLKVLYCFCIFPNLNYPLIYQICDSEEHPKKCHVVSIIHLLQAWPNGSTFASICSLPWQRKLRKEIRLTISYLTIWLIDWQETFIKVVIEPFTTANVATLSRSVWAFELFLSLVINHQQYCRIVKPNNIHTCQCAPSTKQRRNSNSLGSLFSKYWSSPHAWSKMTPFKEYRFRSLHIKSLKILCADSLHNISS